MHQRFTNIIACHCLRAAGVVAVLLGMVGTVGAQSICTTSCSSHPDVPAGTSCLGGLSNTSGLVSMPMGGPVQACTASGTYTLWHATRFDVPTGDVTEITHLCVGTQASAIEEVRIIDATANPNEPSASFPLPTGLWASNFPPVTNVGDTVLIEVEPTTAPLQVTGSFWVVVGYGNVNTGTPTQVIADATATQGTSQTPATQAKSMLAIGDVCSSCGPSSMPFCQNWVDYNSPLLAPSYTDKAPEIRPLRFGVPATCPPFSSYSQDCCDYVCATDPSCCGSWDPGCFDLANANCPTHCLTYIPPSGIYGEIESCGQSTNDTCATAEVVDCDAVAIHGTTFREIDQSVSPPVITADVDWYAVDLTDLNGSGIADFSLDVITEAPLNIEVFKADPTNCQMNQVPQFGGFVPHNCGPGGHHIPGNVGFTPSQTVERFYIRVEPASVPLDNPCNNTNIYTIHFSPTQCQPGSVCNTAPDDCYTVSGPGCNDAACCQDVCACDPFCCNAQWDALCVGPGGCSAIDLCSDCGDPAAGDCCASLGNGTPGCNDFDCCAEVCQIDSFCCNAVDHWDSLCAFHAQNNCAHCVPGPPNELCGNAMPIPLDTTITMDSTNALTDGPSEANCGFTGIQDADLWFEFIAPCDRTYLFRLDEADGTGDRIMGLYTTGCGSPPDSAAVCDGTFTGSIELLLDLVAGETVLIRVGTPGGFAAISELTVTGYCPADITGPNGVPDTVVDVFDLLAVIGNWGLCASPPPSCCEADISGPNNVPDGVVDVFDLLKVIGEWGACP